ncbi:hypothetical protein KXS07_31445 [Inquilinus limosus]|uniref:hypothetical protein n=1 Tax=Inquilinus limosus TaxID=171674 RepID=UPI003F18FC92
MQDHPDISAIVVGDRENPAHIIEILSSGARGYIPSTIGLDVLIEALSLAIVGGTDETFPWPARSL